jgi:hypothetical protein
VGRWYALDYPLPSIKRLCDDATWIEVEEIKLWARL